MKTSKILAGLLVAGLSVAFASGTMSGKMNKDEYKQMKGQKGCPMQDMKQRGGHPHHGFMGGFMASVENLNLSKEQKDSIKKILDEDKPSMVSPAEAFGDDKFDAQKFVDIIQNQKIDRIKHEADLISKVYAVLNAEQKAKLKDEMKNGMSPFMKGKCDKSTSFGR